MSRHKDWLKKKNVKKMFNEADSANVPKVGPVTEKDCVEKRYDPTLKAWFFKRKPQSGCGTGGENIEE